MDSDNSNLFKMLHWNAHGISNYSHLKQLEYILERERVQVASLNETHLNVSHKPYLQNYFIYRNDREGARGGGVALIVRKNLQHTLLNVVNTKKIENLTVEVVINNRRAIITTAYSPKYSSDFRNDILQLTSWDKEFYVLGDFNAKHLSWNCNSTNSAGKVLFNIQQSRDFFIHHTSDPTYYPYQQNRNPSVIDIVLSNSTLDMTLSVLEYEAPSDHRPLICTLHSAIANTVDISHYNFKLTNWNLYQNYIEGRINTHNSSYSSKETIDGDIEKFIDIIIKARNISTPKVSLNNNYVLSKPTIKLLKTRRHLDRKMKRATTQAESNFYKQSIKLISIIIHDKISTERNNKWSKLLSNLQPGDKIFWKLSRSLRGKTNKTVPYLQKDNQQIRIDVEKAELLADTFLRGNNLTSGYKHSVDRTVNSKVNRFKREANNTDGAILTSINELTSIIKSLKTSKSPGLDNISNLLIKKLPTKAIDLLVVLFNSCIKLNYFPKHFKTANIIAIVKPNKPKMDPTSYRPISLLSNIGKLFEKIIHSRISEFVTDNNLIAKEQFGFKKGHSCIQQVNRIKNIVLLNKRKKLSTGLILLDVEKAFDTVWHNGLIYKMLQSNIPKYLCKIILEFLEERKYLVCVNGTHSSPKTTTAGLPQGSVLSPLLYSFYTSDFSPPPNVSTAYYADDTALITSSKLTSALLKKMENGLASCNKYLRKWKIKINPAKTQAIIFPFNKSPKRIPNRNLKFGDEEIPILNDVKYLGVVLDKKLNFSKHIDETSKKCSKVLKALWPLISYRSSLNAKNKNLIFKAVIRPSLTFACPLWYKAAKTHIKKLQIIQNKCLKIINNLRWRYPTDLLHSRSGYEKIHDFMYRLSQNYYNANAQSTYPLIRACREISF